MGREMGISHKCCILAGGDSQGAQGHEDGGKALGWLNTPDSTESAAVLMNGW